MKAETAIALSIVLETIKIRHDENVKSRIPPRGVPNMKFPRKNGGEGNFYKWLPAGEPVRWFVFCALFIPRHRDCWKRRSPAYGPCTRDYLILSPDTSDYMNNTVYNIIKIISISCFYSVTNFSYTITSVSYNIL